MATVAASSTQAPGMPVTPKAPIVSTAATNPTTTQGINRMRLAHERGDGVPTVVEAAKARARAAMFASPEVDNLRPNFLCLWNQLLLIYRQGSLDSLATTRRTVWILARNVNLRWFRCKRQSWKIQMKRMLAWEFTVLWPMHRRDWGRRHLACLKKGWETLKVMTGKRWRICPLVIQPTLRFWIQMHRQVEFLLVLIHHQRLRLLGCRWLTVMSHLILWATTSGAARRSFSERAFEAFLTTRLPMGLKSASSITGSGRGPIWVIAAFWGVILSSIWLWKSATLVWKKTGSTFRCYKPRQELQQRFQERSKPGSMCLSMTFGQLGNWLERSGIYAGRIHCVVYGLDCVVSFSRRWPRYHGVATSTMFSNLADEYFAAWCMVHGWRRQLQWSSVHWCNIGFWFSSAWSVPSQKGVWNFIYGCELQLMTGFDPLVALVMLHGAYMSWWHPWLMSFWTDLEFLSFGRLCLWLCLAGLKSREEVAGCVFGVDKFHFLVHVCMCTSFLKTRQCRRVSTTETRPQRTLLVVVWKESCSCLWVSVLHSVCGFRQLRWP